MINLVHERTPTPEQSKDLRCKNFDEAALGYTPLEAVGEAMRLPGLPGKALRGRLPHPPADPRVPGPGGRGGL